MKGTYFKTSDNKIYKYNREKDYFLLCTPWKSGEDRRKKREDLLNPYKYNKHKAIYEINEIWRNTTFRWVHNNKKYETRGFVFDEKVRIEKKMKYPWSNKEIKYFQTNYTNLFKLCTPHTWSYTSKTGRKFDTTYYLCMYQGKLIWVCPSPYIPQIYFYEFDGVEVEPKRWGGWTNINCIRPIYCVTDKKFI